MITQIFLDAELDPTVVIGGKLPAMGSSGRVGKSDIMVCEACEYVDTFLQLHPAVAVVLNIDAVSYTHLGMLRNLAGQQRCAEPWFRPDRQGLRALY